MPAALQAFITAGYTDGGYAMSSMLNAANHIHNAGVFIGQQQWALAQGQMTAASDDFKYFFRYLLQDDVWSQGLRRDWKDALEWINDNWPSGATVDMDAILAALWESKTIQSFHFVNYIDAMRASIWNTEIYDYHLESWYSHFLSQV